MSDPMRTSKRSIHSSVEAVLAKSPTKLVTVVGAASAPPSLDAAGFVTLTTTSRKVVLIADVLEVYTGPQMSRDILSHPSVETQTWRPPTPLER